MMKALPAGRKIKYLLMLAAAALPLNVALPCEAGEPEGDIVESVRTMDRQTKNAAHIARQILGNENLSRSRVMALLDLIEGDAPETAKNAASILPCLFQDGDYRPDREICARAVRMINTSGDPEIKTCLLIFSALARYQGKELVPILLPLIESSSNHRLRRAAIDAVPPSASGSPGCREMVQALLAALGDRDSPAIRAEAAFALGRMRADDPEVVPALSRQLDDNYLRVRDATTVGLKAYGKSASQAVPKLCEMMESESDYNIRAHSICALSSIGADDPEVFARVYSLIDDPQIGTAVLCHLFKFGPVAAPAVPRMIELMRGENAYLRQRALLNLAHMGSAAMAARPLIERELERGDPESVKLARSALENLDKP
ncbi:MAG: HEAT repeat domain-containing protein [Candidatus Melainabacteria bacterium]|nr:HEAT repeat domain-containing protein [Candidatus Melainabacteria bacterium]